MIDRDVIVYGFHLLGARGYLCSEGSLLTCEGAIGGSLGVVVLLGSTDGYDVEADLWLAEGATDFYGDYDSESVDVYLTDADGNDITVTVSEAKFVNDPTLGDVFTAEGLGDDGNLYTITMKLVLPDPVGTQAITFETLGEYQYYGDTEDWYYVVQDEANIFTLDIYSDDRAGVFEGDDVELGYTQLAFITKIDEENADTTWISFYNMKATITEDEETGEALVVAEGLGKDAILYTITFGYQVVKPTVTVEITDEEAAFADMIDSYGLFAVQGSEGDVCRGRRGLSSRPFPSISPQLSRVLLFLGLRRLSLPACSRRR